MIISRTPLRVSLFGGGTDFKGYYEKYEGAVVSMTIDKFIHIVIKPNSFDDRIILNHFEREAVDCVHEIKHDLFRESLKFTGVTKGVEISVLTDIPLKGTGLGSSSSFTVGLLNALFAYQKKSIDPFELAELASSIEIDIVGSPIGKQDQYAAAFGGLREYVFCKNNQVKAEKIALSTKAYRDLVSHIVLFHTGIERQASTILSDQKKRIEQHCESLHELKLIAKKSKEHFLKSEISKIGELLNQNWEHKKKLSKKIQNEVIEKIYLLGMQQGAYGGKVLGAGGGGFVCFICDPARQKNLKEALKGFKELPVSYEPLGSRVFQI